MDSEPDYEHLFPIAVEVKEGQKYIWCGCGESKNQPFCDKADCGDKSVEYLATLNEEVYFCNCKKTQNPPWCDGTHGKILLEIIKNR